MACGRHFDHVQGVLDDNFTDINGLGFEVT